MTTELRISQEITRVELAVETMKLARALSLKELATNSPVFKSVIGILKQLSMFEENQMMHEQFEQKVKLLEISVSESELMTNPWVERGIRRIKDLLAQSKREKEAIRDQTFMDSFKRLLPSLILVLAACFLAQMGFSSVESSLAAVQTKLVGTILPLVAIVGLVLAGLSFVLGSPNARTHLVLAIIGCLVGFGAQSLVAFIRGLVN